MKRGPRKPKNLICEMVEPGIISEFTPETIEQQRALFTRATHRPWRLWRRGEAQSILNNIDLYVVDGFCFAGDNNPEIIVLAVNNYLPALNEISRLQQENSKYKLIIDTFINGG